MTAIGRIEALLREAKRSAAAKDELVASIAPVRAAIRDRSLPPAKLRGMIEALPPRIDTDFVLHVFGAAAIPGREHPTPIPYAPTPARVILELIDHVPITTGDVFADIGSGLGHVAALVRFLSGARCVGIEIDPAFVGRSLEEAAALDLAIDYRCADVLDADLEATAIFMFAPFPEATMRALLAKLRAKAPPKRLATFACTEQIEGLIDVSVGRLHAGLRIWAFSAENSAL